LRALPDQATVCRRIGRLHSPSSSASSIAPSPTARSGAHSMPLAWAGFWLQHRLSSAGTISASTPCPTRRPPRTAGQQRWRRGGERLDQAPWRPSNSGAAQDFDL